MIEYPVNRDRSSELPQGSSARRVVEALETVYFALEEAKKEAAEEGVLDVLESTAVNVQSGTGEFYDDAMALFRAMKEVNQERLDDLVNSLREARKNIRRKKAAGYEPAYEAAKTRGNTYVASRLDHLLWDAIQSALVAGVHLDLDVTTFGDGFQSKYDADPDFYGNEIREDLPESTDGGAFGIGGSPFKPL